jgi:hypothetical protein
MSTTPILPMDEVLSAYYLRLRASTARACSPT